MNFGAKIQILSPEKLPKLLSAMPNLKGAQRVRTKIFFTFFRQINEAQTLNFGAKIQLIITRKIAQILIGNAKS